MHDERVAGARAAIEGGEDDVGGTTLEQARRDAVVLVLSSKGVCSGTLITPRLVLTAQHCTSAGTGAYWVQFGVERVPASPTRVPVVGCIPAPGVARCGDPGWVEDTALLILDRRVDADSSGGDRTGVWPAIPAGVQIEDPIGSSGVPDPQEWVGQSLTAVGYGLTSSGGPQPDNRQRRDVTVQSVTDHRFMIDANSTWDGDSGGPSYLGDPAVEQIEVLGVHTNPPTEHRLTDPVIRSWLVPWLTGTWDGVYVGPVDVPLAGEPERTAEDDTVDPDGDGLAPSVPM